MIWLDLISFIVWPWADSPRLYGAAPRGRKAKGERYKTRDEAL